MIQESLRNELKKDVTIITVAHRLQTIMDADKIVRLFSLSLHLSIFFILPLSLLLMLRPVLLQMVLDAGKIVEFDKPSVLLEKEGGFLKSLVDESGDREALYAVAGSSRS